MNSLIIAETLETPGIDFNPETGVLKISGRAYSSDITVFYKSLSAWLDDYTNNPKDTVIELYLDYYNSVFHKLLFNFLKKCKTVLEKDKTLVIKWFYNDGDEDSIDASISYAKSLDYPIEKIELE
ncbi:MAG: SiaC family regulatory phosphoprotein [Bacteroidia bacterium]|nr:SiaC family regulatory phosphoprotein [Bacteroidia bacterium]